MKTLVAPIKSVTIRQHNGVAVSPAAVAVSGQTRDEIARGIEAHWGQRIVGYLDRADAAGHGIIWCIADGTQIVRVDRIDNV